MYEQILPTIKLAEAATSPLPGLAPQPLPLNVQEDLYKNLKVSSKLRQLFELPRHFWKLLNSTYIQKKHVGAIKTAVCLPVLPKPFLRISIHKKRRLPTPCSLGPLSKDKRMGKHIAMAGKKRGNQGRKYSSILRKKYQKLKRPSG